MRCRKIALVTLIRGFATELQTAPAQVALAWVAQQAGVTAPIVGASKLQHLDDAVAALSLHLAPDELQALQASARALNDTFAKVKGA